MSFENNDIITNVQAKLKLHIDELENNLKYDKVYWQNYNLDKVSVENVVENHHVEIMHHIEQIKYHLEKVNYHKKQLDDIDNNLNIGHSKTSTHAEEGDESLFNQGDVVKRPDVDKLRFKVRRVSKACSLKYVLQWENLLEEQKEETFLNSVHHRNKYKSSPNINVGTSQMVKDRIEKFEGYQKPKRQSSTVETFLDFSGETPRRIKSYPIIEDAEGEKELEVIRSVNSNISSQPEIGQVSKCDKENSVEIEKTNFVKSDDEEGENCCVVLNDVDYSNARALSKPRIVEMHYKQPGTAAEDL